MGKCLQLGHWHSLQASQGKFTTNFFLVWASGVFANPSPGNTKGGSITVPLTSCLTGLESAV